GSFTLSLHDALPISDRTACWTRRAGCWICGRSCRTLSSCDHPSGVGRPGVLLGPSSRWGTEERVHTAVDVIRSKRDGQELTGERSEEHTSELQSREK